MLYASKSTSLLFRSFKSLELYPESIFAETCLPKWVHRKQMRWVLENRRGLGFCQPPFQAYITTYICIGMELSTVIHHCVYVCGRGGGSLPPEVYAGFCSLTNST